MSNPNRYKLSAALIAMTFAVSSPFMALAAPGHGKPAHHANKVPPGITKKIDQPKTDPAKPDPAAKPAPAANNNNDPRPGPATGPASVSGSQNAWWNIFSDWFRNYYNHNQNNDNNQSQANSDSDNDGDGAIASADASTSAVGNLPPVISGISSPTVLQVGQTGTWSVNASDPQNGTLSYSVDWGDNA
ncbi:MAG: hypothetical protein KGI49_02835, partial [Patescibacteria group bacterium]|nr:hypothetical protein [Patescibacteria group bacterium]